MIHACPERMWYVKQFLIPSMLKQGIKHSEIIVWNDRDHIGNLKSCLQSFASCGGMPGGTWHLQDDVLLSREFAEQTRKHSGERIVCGFCYVGYENGTPITGEVFPALMWNSSFPCIYIPNRIAEEFVRWYYFEALPDPDYSDWIQSGKMDDTFFCSFYTAKHPNNIVLNLAPHLVEHVDYIIGGSTINTWRGHTTRAYYFDDEELVEELTREVVKLKSHREATTLKA